MRAALILGSRARSDHPADAWSDLDMLVVTRNPDQFVQSVQWVSEIVPFWLTFVERIADGQSWERRTLFEEGLDVDFSLVATNWLDGILLHMPSEVADIIRSGVKVLVDKDGKLKQMLQLPLPSSILFMRPTEVEFINAVSDFWFHALWSAKHLLRGELWWAKSGVDVRLKERLLNMLEWHAHATQSDEVNTWQRGRFLEKWADPRAVKQLRDVFAHYESQDVAKALRATIYLYRWLEDETADRWGFNCPLNGETQTQITTLKVLEAIN